MLAETDLQSGTYVCTGNYGGYELSSVKISKVALTKTTYVYYQWYATTQVWINHAYYDYQWSYRWERIPPKYQYTIQLYNSAGASFYDKSDIYEEAGTWVKGASYGGVGDPSQSDPPTAASPVGGTEVFPTSGSLSFTAGAHTMRLIGIPYGDSADYLTGTVYKDLNGFLKVK